MEKATFTIDDPAMEETQIVSGDYLINFTRFQKEEAQKEIDNLSSELGYEISLEPKHV